MHCTEYSNEDNYLHFKSINTNSKLKFNFKQSLFSDQRYASHKHKLQFVKFNSLLLNTHFGVFELLLYSTVVQYTAFYQN